MARTRYFGSMRAPESSDRATIGDSTVSFASEAITRTQKLAVATLTDYPFDRERTLMEMFPADVLAKSRAVKGMVRPFTSIIAYKLNGATLFIDYENSPVVALQPEAMEEFAPRATAMRAYIDAVLAVHLQYEEVKGVLRWLNRNATAGAIRFFWPTALKLCPNATCFASLQQVPSRYTTPEGVNDMMQAIRDSANTVVGSLMLPTKPLPPHNTMWLTFGERKVTLGDQHYITDSVTYNI